MRHKLLQPWNAEQWLSAFGKAEADIHMLRTLRKQVYEYTVQAAMQGTYEIIKTDPKTNAKQIQTVSLPLDPDIAKKTKMYRSEQNPPVLNRYEKTEYKVLAQDCLVTAKIFVEQNEGKVAVLNMASRSNPGGGVYGGAGAQEEYCFRCSDYFRSLYQFVDYAPAYGVDRSHKSYPLDRNFGGVYSPGVTIFRGTEEEGYPFLEKPWQVNFIAVAGINNPDTVTKQDGREWLTEPMVAGTKNKLRSILNIAIDNEIDVLVLGAIGCGAFHNPPHHVALLFKEIFEEPAYRNAFKKVVFAIKKDHNSRKTELAKIFEEVFHLNLRISEREDVVEIVSHLQNSKLENRYLALFDKACRYCSQDMLAFLDGEKQRIKNKLNEELKTLLMEIDTVKANIASASKEADKRRSLKKLYELETHYDHTIRCRDGRTNTDAFIEAVEHDIRTKEIRWAVEFVCNETRDNVVDVLVLPVINQCQPEFGAFGPLYYYKNDFCYIRKDSSYWFSLKANEGAGTVAAYLPSDV